MAIRLRDNNIATADARVQLAVDEADRLSEIMGSTDRAVISLQDDDDSMWILQNWDPLTWIQIQTTDESGTAIDVAATGAGPIALPLVKFIYLTNITKAQSYLLPQFGVTVPDGFEIWVIAEDAIGAFTQSVRNNVGQFILNPDSTPPDTLDITNDFGNVHLKWDASISSWVTLSRI